MANGYRSSRHRCFPKIPYNWNRSQPFIHSQECLLHDLFSDLRFHKITPKPFCPHCIRKPMEPKIDIYLFVSRCVKGLISCKKCNSDARSEETTYRADSMIGPIQWETHFSLSFICQNIKYIVINVIIVITHTKKNFVVTRVKWLPLFAHFEQHSQHYTIAFIEQINVSSVNIVLFKGLNNCVHLRPIYSVVVLIVTYTQESQYPV